MTVEIDLYLKVERLNVLWTLFRSRRRFYIEVSEWFGAVSELCIGRTESVDYRNNVIEFKVPIRLHQFPDRVQTFRAKIFEGTSNDQREYFGISDGIQLPPTQHALFTRSPFYFRKNGVVVGTLTIRGIPLSSTRGYFTADISIPVSRFNSPVCLCISRSEGEIPPIAVVEVPDLQVGEVGRSLKLPLREVGCHAYTTCQMTVSLYHKDCEHPLQSYPFSLQQVLDVGHELRLPLPCPRRPAEVDEPVVVFRNPRIEPLPPFQYYLQGNNAISVSVTVALDFTLSNGDPRQQNSYHHLVDNGENIYQQHLRVGLQQIGNMVRMEEKIKVYGFGVHPRTAEGIGRVDHCYSLTGTDSAEVRGVEGALAAYREIVPSISPAKTTVLCPILDRTLTAVRDLPNRYNLLFVITTGDISDVADVKEIIKGLSGLPLSVVMIGVGSSDRNRSLDQLASLEKTVTVVKEIAGMPVEQTVEYSLRHIPQQMARYEEDHHLPIN